MQNTCASSLIIISQLSALSGSLFCLWARLLLPVTVNTIHEVSYNTGTTVISVATRFHDACHCIDQVRFVPAVLSQFSKHNPNPQCTVCVRKQYLDEVQYRPQLTTTCLKINLCWVPLPEGLSKHTSSAPVLLTHPALRQLAKDPLWTRAPPLS